MADYNLKVLEYFDDGDNVRFEVEEDGDITLWAYKDTYCLWPDKEWKVVWRFSSNEISALQDFINYFAPKEDNE